MTGHQVIANLRTRGIGIRFDGGKLRLSAPPGRITEEVRTLLSGRKPELLAILGGLPVPSHVPDIVWTAAGGVRVSDPEFVARLAAWNEAKRRQFPVVGRDGWASFANTAPMGEVLNVLLVVC